MHILPLTQKLIELCKLGSRPKFETVQPNFTFSRTVRPVNLPMCFFLTPVVECVEEEGPKVVPSAEGEGQRIMVKRTPGFHQKRFCRVAELSWFFTLCVNLHQVPAPAVQSPPEQIHRTSANAGA